jgi:lysozyme
MKITRALVTVSLMLTACASSSDPSRECTDSTSEELRRCAAGATLKGVDVSFYQGNVSWSKVRRSGHRFAFARVSDGTRFPDSKFHTNWLGMRRAGLVRGVYQFFRPGQSAHAQANLMIAKLHAAGGLKAGDLPPVLDVEVTDGHSASFVVARAKQWLSYVEAKTGHRPIVYTAAFMSSVLGGHLGGYRLWVANFGVSCPTLPSGWSHWQFFQNSDRGRVPGISGGVDTDVFNGNLTHLKSATLLKKARLAGEAPDDLVDETPSKDVEDAEVQLDFEDGIVPADDVPNDGTNGMTIGSQAVSDAPADDAPLPCASATP